MSTKLTTILTDGTTINIIKDINGGVYSEDGRIFVKYEGNNKHYKMLPSVEIVCNEAFMDNKTIEEVVLSDNLNEIGEHAFYNCSSLTYISIPKNVQSIPEGAFANCKSLSFIDLNQNLQEIGNWAFSGCITLDSVELPDTINSIGDFAFVGCKALSFMPLPKHEGIVVGKYAFCDCPNLNVVITTTDFELKTGIVNCGNNIYVTRSKVANVQELLNLDGVIGCDVFAIEETDNIVYFNHIEVKDDGLGGMYSEDGIVLVRYEGNSESYKVKDNTKYICSFAFENNANIKKIIFPDSLVHIGYHIIRGCNHLESFEMGKPQGYFDVKSGGLCKYAGPHTILYCFPPASKENIDGVDIFRSYSLEGLNSGISISAPSYSTLRTRALYNCNIHRLEFYDDRYVNDYMQRDVPILERDVFRAFSSEYVYVSSKEKYIEDDSQWAKVKNLYGPIK